MGNFSTASERARPTPDVFLAPPGNPPRATWPNIAFATATARSSGPEKSRSSATSRRTHSSAASSARVRIVAVRRKDRAPYCGGTLAPHLMSKAANFHAVSADSTGRRHVIDAKAINHIGIAV